MDDVGKLMTKTNCPTCGKTYKQIGNHWQFNEDHIPDLTDRQHSILRGLVLGDGFISHRDRNAALWVSSTNRDFLSWIQKQFPVLANRVRVEKTVEQLYEQNTRSEYIDTPSDDADYNTLYKITTTTHPEIAEYDNDEKSVRDLSSVGLKVYYVSDGVLAEAGKTYRPQFRVVDEQRRDYIATLIRDCGFDVTVSTGSLYIKQSQTERFFEYIGDPISGFERKWL